MESISRLTKAIRVIVSFLLAIGITFALVPTAYSIENGVDATGSPYVVPIETQVSATGYIGCSGALIAPLIVVTAAHCVVDSSGLLTQKVYAGKAGASMDSVSLDDIVSSIQITSSFQEGSNGTVGSDDLAFLTLSQVQTMPGKILLASESQMNQMLTSNAPLMVVGYGIYADTSTDPVTFPKSLTGVFSSSNTGYINSGYFKSTSGDICQGDSGAPVLNITATQVTVVGVITGGPINIHCSKKDPDGTYHGLFTLIGRYANLAFSASTDAMNALQTQLTGANQSVSSLTDQLHSSESQLNQANSDLGTAQSSLSDTQASLDAANKQIMTLESKLPKSIVCTKGKLIQKITGILPKCPTGFKLKSN